MEVWKLATISTAIACIPLAVAIACLISEVIWERKQQRENENDGGNNGT